MKKGILLNSVLLYGRYFSLVRIVISPSKPVYLKVSAAERAATPPPTITNLLLSLPFLDMGIVFGTLSLLFGTFMCSFPSC